MEHRKETGKVHFTEQVPTFFFAHYREVGDPVTVSTVFNTFSLTVTDSLYSYQMGKENAISHLKHISL
jgi:hypothetical protein